MNLTKKLFLSLIATACMAQTMQAVPAIKRPLTVRQADGTELTIIVQGDEHGHLAMTADGYPLFFNEANQTYEYADLSNGAVVGSGIAAADLGRRNATATAFLKTQHADDIRQAMTNRRLGKLSQRCAKGVNRMRINNYPTTGEQHPLIILVEFSDVPFTTVGDDPQAFYNRWFNEEGFTYTNGANGSVSDYYRTSSFDKFLPTFDVYGPVTMPKTCSYYGANSGGDDQYDRIAEMVEEACSQLDSIVDFSQYDNDGDGVVDNVYIFYAGYGEADSYKSSTIWPHQAKLSDFGFDNVTFDGVRIDSYGCCQEINGQLSTPTVAGIGTFVHEFGHVLGLPDLYDIYYSSATFTPDSYDIMDAGGYNNNGNTPPLFSAFERGELGWLDYVELTTSADSLVSLPTLATSNKAYRVSVEGTDGQEFYVLENRQQEGWDAYIPGHGMLMWHIDIDSTVWINNTVNAVGSHQRVDLVEADNRRTESTRPADAFPGTANVTRWTMTSWDGLPLLTLDDIEEKDDTINIILGGLDITIPSPLLTVTAVSDSSAVLEWNEERMAKQYSLNVYETTADGQTLLGDWTNKTYTSADTCQITGLKASTQYTATLVAQRGSYTSDTVSVSFTTDTLSFEKMRIDSVYATDITSDGFTANWSALNYADGYTVTLSELGYSDETTVRGYDFSDRASGMPSLWTYKGSFISMNNYYGEAAPSLRFTSAGGQLLMAYANSRIDSLSFWGRASSTAGGKVVIESYADSTWQEIASFEPIDDEATAKTRSYTFAPSDSVRISFSSATTGTFYIDDVVVGCHDIVGTPLEQYNELSVGNVLSYHFSGLDNDKTYRFSVCGTQGSHSSSLEHLVVTLSNGDNTSVPTIHHSPSTVHYYDLSGRRMPSLSNLPKGIYIMKQGDKSVKIVKR